MELGNQRLYDSKHCETSAGATTEAKLCYDLKNFNVHKSNTTSTPAVESGLDPGCRCPGEIAEFELSLLKGHLETWLKVTNVEKPL